MGGGRPQLLPRLYQHGTWSGQLVFMNSTALRTAGRSPGLQEDSSGLWFCQMNYALEIKGFHWAQIKSGPGMVEPVGLWDLGSCAVARRNLAFKHWYY